VAKVDMTENKALQGRFDIKGFPTLKFFSKGDMYPFSGKRDIGLLVH
jgi:hypothetical protein